MFEGPKVSVIIPTKDRKYFLSEAIESVLCQSYKDIEIIVVDDGSKDGSMEYIINRYRSYLDRIVYIYRSNSRGVSAARNCGLLSARGEYISFLDSDDLWARDKIAEELKILRRKRYYKAIYTDEKWFRNKKHLNQKKRHRKYSGHIYSRCLPLCIISASSILFSREVLDRVGYFDESLSACEDYDYWLRLCSIYPIYYLEKKLVIKRGGHADQLSKKYEIMDEFRVRALIKILNLKILTKTYEDETKKEIIKKVNIIKQGLIKRGKLTELKQYELVLRELS